MTPVKVVQERVTQDITMVKMMCSKGKVQSVDRMWTEYVVKNKFNSQSNGTCRFIVFIILCIFLVPFLLLTFVSGLLVPIES